MSGVEGSGIGGGDGIGVDDKIIDLANKIAAKKQEKKEKYGGRPPGHEGEDRRVTIKLPVGDISDNIDLIEKTVMNGGGFGIYKYGTTLCEIVWETIKVSGGEKDKALHHSMMDADSLLQKWSTACLFKKWNNTVGDWVYCDCPRNIAEGYLSRKGAWSIPQLVGVVTVPTFRPDGSLIWSNGYDEATGLFYDNLGVKYPVIGVDREDGLEGVRLLKKLLRGFNFISGEDLSVALSGIISAVVRQSLPVVPMHCFDAPVAGSGKSMLVDIASVIATGHRAPVIAVGNENESEFEKRLNSTLVAGDTVVAIDNIDEPLKSQLLCQVLTQYAVRVRLFGKLELVTVPTIAMYFGNGNNLTLIGDLNRRALVSRIDPMVERPELNEFPFNPVKLAMKARAKLVWACLSIVAAYRASKAKGPKPLGSYEEWSKMVRNALIWLGEEDPIKVMEKTRKGDPVLSKLIILMRCWLDVIGSNDNFKTRDIIKKANETTYNDDGQSGVLKNEHLFDALFSIAGGTNGNILPDKLGLFLRKNLNRTIYIDQTPYRFEEGQMYNHTATWILRKIKYVNKNLPKMDNRKMPEIREDTEF